MSGGHVSNELLEMVTMTAASVLLDKKHGLEAGFQME